MFYYDMFYYDMFYYDMLWFDGFGLKVHSIQKKNNEQTKW